MAVRPRLVLIVDDEPLMRWAVAETLTGQGCIVVEAGDALAAVALLTDAGRRFDVVMLDYRVPEAEGLELLAVTRRLSPESQVIMLSAFMAPDVAAHALQLGAYRVLPKPIDLAGLAALVMEAPAVRQAPVTDAPGR